MNWKDDWKKLFWGFLIFAGFYFLPIETERWQTAIVQAFDLAKWYAQEHVILCLIPAFFIAGAIAVFIGQNAIINYLGAKAKKWLALAIASVSGSILAVCSCTILPLFAGIYKRGAGLGPAIAFLYSGPAINVMAIILTARVLGVEIGIARAVGAVVFSVIIGIIMNVIYHKEEAEKAASALLLPEEAPVRPLWQNIIFFALMVGILVFVNWGKPADNNGLWALIYQSKWTITVIGSLLFGLILIKWMKLSWLLLGIVTVLSTLVYFFTQNHNFTFLTAVVGLSILLSRSEGENSDWMSETWSFTKQIAPLLLFGVLAAGFLLGNPTSSAEGVIPASWISSLVGGNSIWANLFASVVGAFMYFATLTEIPILQGLLASGMGKGPALALLLAGPALSLPNMLVIRSVIGIQKTAVFVALVVIMATISGIIYGGLL